MSSKALTVFYMLNGQTIIGYPVKDDGNDVVVEQPLILAMKPMPNGDVQMNMFPLGFPLFQDAKMQPKEMRINRLGMSHSLELANTINNKQMYDNHRSLFSNIISAANAGSGIKLG